MEVELGTEAESGDGEKTRRPIGCVAKHSANGLRQTGVAIPSQVAPEVDRIHWGLTNIDIRVAESIAWF